MPSPVDPSSVVDRRLLLRGGAVLAGAVGVAAVGAVVNTSTAEAADGDELLVARNNAGTEQTVLTMSPPSATATLGLVNESGPQLRLLPVGNDFEGDLQPGDIVSTNFGPVIGVIRGAGREVDILVTGADLDEIPTPVAIDPQRLLDTRTVSGRSNVVRKSSPSALTAAGKLNAGQWIDVAIDTAEGPFSLSAIFANAAVVSPEKGGYLTIYPPSSTVPSTSNINYRAGEALANACFVGVGIYAGDYVVRIRTSTTTHLIFDLSGAVASTAPQRPADNKAAGKAATSNRRTQRQAKQRARIKASLEHA